MTQEEKQLLLKDLCARLPYGTMVNFTLGDIRFDEIVSSVDVNGSNVQVYTKHGFLRCPLEGDPEIELSQVKPYLRPMLSMTEEEHVKLKAVYDNGSNGLFDEYSHIDWLNANHFDYRGMIEKGLALEAPDGMYKN